MGQVGGPLGLQNLTYLGCLGVSWVSFGKVLGRFGGLLASKICLILGILGYLGCLDCLGCLYCLLYVVKIGEVVFDRRPDKRIIP